MFSEYLICSACFCSTPGAATPAFVPPPAVFDDDFAIKSVGDVISSITAASGSAGGNGKRGRKPVKK